MARSVGPAPSHQHVIHGVPELCQPPTLLFADLVGTVLLVLPAAMGGPLWTVVAGIVAAGAGASLWSVLVAVLRQERTPPALLGRVYSASRVLSWGALPLGSALAAFLAHWLDVGQILGAAAVLAIMTAAWFPLLRINRHIAAEDTQVSLKELGRPLPDFSNSPDPDAQV